MKVYTIFGILLKNKKYIISLSETDVNKLQTIIHKIDAFKSIIQRCQILLELNENTPKHLPQMQITNSFGVCKATVSNIVKDYMEQVLDASITYKRNPNSNAKRKEDGRDEARIIELAGSQPPNGRTRWNLRLLEEKIRGIPPKENAPFVARMEDRPGLANMSVSYTHLTLPTIYSV